MCSIVITFNESNPHNLKRMAEAVQHRGPDSFEIWPAGKHGIAACRLSIFGDSCASMIQLDPDTGYVVLVNGEIYNYRELWNDLSKSGFQPRTDLEAELIARMYQVHGLNFVEHLKGMFAIALLDRDSLVLARDSFGIKPLYYASVGRKVIVCSEIKGILAHPQINPHLNLQSLKETSVFGYVVDQEATFFEDIHQVRPGSAITVSADGTIEKHGFFKAPEARYANGDLHPAYNDACTEVREHLIRTVDRIFSHGSMEKGIYLSGGLDSSIMALIAKRILNYPVKTFTLSDAEENPDFKAARGVAKALETQHYDYWRALPDYVAHFESLMAGGVFHIQGGIAFHLLSEKVAQHVRVAFSGEGADELFGGYYWVYTHPLGFSDRIKGNLQNILPDGNVADIVSKLFPEPEDEQTYKRNLFDHLLKGGLSNYHLQSVDRSAGAFGFEIRPLYLYDDISHHAMELPIEYKVPDKKTTKRILRDAFKKDFENAGIEWVNDRLKMGMPSAISEIDKEVTLAVEKAISDEELTQHHLGKILGSKMNLLLFDIFEHIFFKGWDHREAHPPKNSLLARVWPE
jgi:asparagine synthase (glutamine-hydrolysing)